APSTWSPPSACTSTPTAGCSTCPARSRSRSWPRWSREPSSFVASSNPLRAALAAGRFCYLVELVASRLAREARLLEIASGLARVPGVVAGSITSYAGGAPGQDPLRIGAAARARGLSPRLHDTCVHLDRTSLRKLIEAAVDIGVQNSFDMSV